MGFEITVSNINEYLEVVFESSKELKKDVIHNEVLYYRGHDDVSFNIVPSIARNRKFPTDISILDEERNLIEMAKYKLPDIFRNDLAPIDLLALLQHHGIPTRLLDITANPLVSLYFAVRNKNLFDVDGEVIVFKNNESNITNYPIINAIAESYKFAYATNVDLSSFYEKVKEQPYFLEQKYDLNECFSFDGGGKWIQECCKKIIILYAQEHSERQKSQQGRYILFPNDIVNRKGLYFSKTISPIKKEENSIFRRILIPKEYKEDILSKLEILGVSEYTLFSDNVDIVCKSVVGSVSRRLKH